MNIREKTCCFTGHRDIPRAVYSSLSRELDAVVRALIGKGVRFFGAGGALGFDMLAAETVLRLRQIYPQIRLILVLPCRDQTQGWRQEDVARYEGIKEQADKVVYTSERYTPGCMHRRNRHLVEHSSVCVAYCIRSSGGSAYTVEYARQHGLRVFLLGGASEQAGPFFR